MCCFITRTTESTHQLIRENLNETPTYGGWVEAKGPRYCPSIEDKVYFILQMLIISYGWTSNSYTFHVPNLHHSGKVLRKFLRKMRYKSSGSRICSILKVFLGYLAYNLLPIQCCATRKERQTFSWIVNLMSLVLAFEFLLWPLCFPWNIRAP